MYGIWRLRGRKTSTGTAPRWGLLFVYAYVAGLSHILLDFTNNYGVRPFWPFWEKWYSWDIVFIIEPLILVILGAGLVLPAYFGLINEEIAGRRKRVTGSLRCDASVAGPSRSMGRSGLRASSSRGCAPIPHVRACGRCSRFRIPLLADAVSLVRSG